MEVFFAVIPVFLIIFAGFVCRIKNFPGDGFWSGAERITYYVFFPCLLVTKLSQADISSINFPLMTVVIVFVLVMASVLMLALNIFIRLSGKEFTSVFQGGIRFNAYIGFALTASLYGNEGLIYAAVIIAIMIVTVNILCVSVLEYHRIHHTNSGFYQLCQRLLHSIITNPLIIGSVTGIVLNAFGVVLYEVVDVTLDLLAKVGLPLGVMTVGAALNLHSVKSALKPLVFTGTIKFLILPLLAFVACYIFNIDGIVREIVLVLAVLPTATSSYILAKQLDGDATLMATIITVETLMAAILIPVLLSVLI